MAETKQALEAPTASSITPGRLTRCSPARPSYQLPGASEDRGQRDSLLPLARAQRGPCDEMAARGPLPGVTGMTSRDIPEHRKHGPGAGGGGRVLGH